MLQFNNDDTFTTIAGKARGRVSVKPYILALEWVKQSLMMP